jgi:haloalkane dehalogenase
MYQKPEWLKKMFPWEQKELTVNGQQMAYVDEGPKNAPPVILQHGNPVWGFLNRYFVDPLLKAGYRVVVPDCIGAGYSSKPRHDGCYSLARHIADQVSLIDQLDLTNFTMVGQDWGGPQGMGAALQRLDRCAAQVWMNTWFYTDYKGPFHQSPRPWTTWHAPIIGPIFMKHFKILSRGGPSTIAKRTMTTAEKRGYHHIYDEPDSETVTMTWPRTIPLTEGDRGWADMQRIEKQLPRLAKTPILVIWGVDDPVFNVEYRDHMMKLLPHAEGPINFDNASHFLQDDRGPDIVKAIIPFLDRVVKR